jgi:hypothetical protein
MLGRVASGQLLGIAREEALPLAAKIVQQLRRHTPHADD